MLVENYTVRHSRIAATGLNFNRYSFCSTKSPLNAWKDSLATKKRWNFENVVKIECNVRENLRWWKWSLPRYLFVDGANANESLPNFLFKRLSVLRQCTIVLLFPLSFRPFLCLSLSPSLTLSFSPSDILLREARRRFEFPATLRVLATVLINRLTYALPLRQVWYIFSSSTLSPISR